MTARRPLRPLDSVHIELFVTRRSDRPRVRSGSKRLYSLARRATQSAGGSGPHLFLLERRPRPRRRPENLRSAIGARTDEDVWLELTFYPSAKSRRRILRALWANSQVARLAGAVESLNLTRKRAWTLATGASQPT